MIDLYYCSWQPNYKGRPHTPTQSVLEFHCCFTIQIWRYVPAAHLGIVPPNYIWISKEPREKSVNSIRRLIAHKHTPVNDGKNWRMRDRMCDGEKEKWPEELDTALSRCSYQRSVDPHSEMMAGMQNLNWIRSNFQYLIKHSSIWLCSEWANTDNIYRIFKRLLELNLFHTVLQEAKLNGGQLEEPSRSPNRIYKAYFIAWKWIHHKNVNWQLTNMKISKNFKG